jgi:exodeoxyribonuclease VII small subunit
LSPPRKHPPAESAPTFEAAFTELQQVVQQLEDGSLDLERALALFDQGSRLAEAANRCLDAAELHVSRLTPESAFALSDSADDPNRTADT